MPASIRVSIGFRAARYSGNVICFSPYAGRQLVELRLVGREAVLRGGGLGVLAGAHRRALRRARACRAGTGRPRRSASSTGSARTADAAAARQARALRADVPAGAVGPRPGDEGRVAVGAAQQAARQEVAAHGPPGQRARGCRGSRGGRAVSSGVRIGSPVARSRRSRPCTRAGRTDAGRDEHPPEDMRRPRSARRRSRRRARSSRTPSARRLSPARMRAAASRTTAASVGSTVRRSARYPNGRDPSAGRLAGLRQLQVLARDAPALVVALLAGHGTQDTREEAPVVGGEVGVAGDRCQRAQAGGVAHLEELLEFLGLAVQPVEVPHDHGVDRTRRGCRRASAGSADGPCPSRRSGRHRHTPRRRASHGARRGRGSRPPGG